MMRRGRWRSGRDARRPTRPPRGSPCAERARTPRRCPRASTPASRGRRRGSCSPALALGAAEHVVDGDPQLRARPLAPLVRRARRRSASTSVRSGSRGRLPLAVRGPARGGPVAIAGNLSSQFVSGLLMAGPRMERGLEIELSSPLVVGPLRRDDARGDGGLRRRRRPGSPCAHAALRSRRDYAIEPDASAASYFLAAAAITGGRVAIEGLGARLDPGRRRVRRGARADGRARRALAGADRRERRGRAARRRRRHVGHLRHRADARRGRRVRRRARRACAAIGFIRAQGDRPDRRDRRRADARRASTRRRTRTVSASSPGRFAARASRPTTTTAWR